MSEKPLLARGALGARRAHSRPDKLLKPNETLERPEEVGARWVLLASEKPLRP